jgi:precorrin-6B methylase 2
MSTGYVLPLAETELDRYRLMAEAARRDEAALWAAAGIAAGARVADIGCGPGAITVELAEIVGPSGLVIAVDEDEAALRVASDVVQSRRIQNVTTRSGKATATGIEAASIDTAIIRHVLAHNGGDEQAIINHAASLVRPGGSVLVVDVDLTAQRYLPEDADLVDLHQRYVNMHRDRGNDPTVGLRLGELVRRSGLDLVNHCGWYLMLPATPGRRPPAWVARDAIAAAGHASPDDVQRWSAALDRIDHRSAPPTIFVSVFAATGARRS